MKNTIYKNTRGGFNAARTAAAVFAAGTMVVGAAQQVSADNFTESCEQTAGSHTVIAAAAAKNKQKQTETVGNRYYRVAKTAKLYEKTSKGVKLSKTSLSKAFYASGKLAKSNGNVLKKGQKTADAKYIKLTSGIHKGSYIKIDAAKHCLGEDKVYAKRRIVADYGKSMNGGSYVYGASGYRRTDCSGLTMQCYAQIGMDISHSTYYQARMGKSVKLCDIEIGDILVLNYRSHVALYVGGGKMVHAMNSWDGIKVEPIEKLKYYHIDTIRRIIK